MDDITPIDGPGVVVTMAKFKPIDAALMAAAADVDALVINGPDDTANYKLVVAGIQRMTKFRTTLEAARVELKAPFLEAGRRIDAEADRLKKITASSEARLRTIRQVVDDERAELKATAERLALEKFRARTDALFAVGFSFNGFAYMAATLELSAADVQNQDDQWFDAALSVGKTRLAEAAEVQRLERERQTQERQRLAEFERQANEFAKAKERAEAINTVEPGANISPADVIKYDTLQVSQDEVLRDINTLTEMASVDDMVAFGAHLGPEDDESIAGRPLTYADGLHVGFTQCRTQVLRILETSGPMRREQLQSLIRHLKPA